jgi:hypothetical protein
MRRFRNEVSMKFLSALLVAFAAVHAAAAEPPQLADGLIAHWPLVEDGRDIAGGKRHAVPHGVTFAVDPEFDAAGRAARFSGRESYLEVPAALVPKFGRGDFSIAMRIRSPETSVGPAGDLVSCYDPERRRGFHLTLKSDAGVTFNQASRRQLQFGIDDDRSSRWIDCGRPGQATLAFALAVHDGSLYAGTCEPDAGRSGRVYRYGGDERWLDCGAPDPSNAVTALAVFDGRLYAGTGKYRLAGSALVESPNMHLGGKVYRYEGDKRWTDCGRLPNTEAVGGLVEFRGRLYASSLYKPAGFFRYESGTEWKVCVVPNERRVEAMCVFDDHLYASSYDAGRVYRFDGTKWTDCGQLGNNTQTYSFAVYQRRLLVGTWPSGRVYRFEDVDRWTDIGRLGNELEVMGMLVHNGRLLAGTLPSAEVYAYDGDTKWNLLKQLDATPNVKYRRAWTMAEHQGRLFCSTLPSGRIFAFEAGKTAAYEQEFPEGRRHITAVKRGAALSLHIDGVEVATSTPLDPQHFNLDTDAPLRIGRGLIDDFRGTMSDVRLYDRALTAEEITALAKSAK